VRERVGKETQKEREREVREKGGKERKRERERERPIASAHMSCRCLRSFDLFFLPVPLFSKKKAQIDKKKLLQNPSIWIF